MAGSKKQKLNTDSSVVAEVEGTHQHLPGIICMTLFLAAILMMVMAKTRIVQMMRMVMEIILITVRVESSIYKRYETKDY